MLGLHLTLASIYDMRLKFSLGGRIQTRGIQTDSVPNIGCMQRDAG